MGNNLSRKTLAQIPYVPEPETIIKVLENADYGYSRNLEEYIIRDKSLVALTYLCATRISETLRLSKHQFKFNVNSSFILIESIELSKSFRKGKLRNDVYRSAVLPLQGDRKPLTDMVLAHLENVEDKLYSFGRTRAWQIFTKILPESTCHWFRSYGENYLYDNWDYDLVALSNYVKVDVATLMKYLKSDWKKYQVV